MKAYLIFNLPDDRTSFMAAAKSGDMAIALFEITSNLKRRAEWWLEGGDKTAGELLDYIFNEIHATVNEQGIDIDQLTE